MQIIKTTKNYDKFKTLLGNRILYREHLNLLVMKIKQKNLLHLNPIIVNERDEVIDGQHRLAAAKTIGVPIFYLQESGLGVDDVIILNTASKRWKFEDYLRFYSEQGFEDYVILTETVKKYGLTAHVTAGILSSDYENLKTPTVPVKRFKAGEFKIIDLKESVVFIDKLKQIRPYTMGNLVWNDREFIRALWLMYYKHGASHELLLNKFKDKGTLISYRESTRDYLFQLVDVAGRRGVESKINVFANN